MNVIAIIGMPGTGKTSLVGALLPRLGLGEPWVFRTLRGVYFAEFGGSVLGVYDSGVFSGTDRLSMSVQPSAQSFIHGQTGQDTPADKRQKFCIFEGDRLGNVSFLNFCQQRANLTVLCLQANQETLNGRYATRGGKQSPSWLRGRETKVNNICQRFNELTQLHKHDSPGDTQRILRAIMGMINNGYSTNTTDTT